MKTLLALFVTAAAAFGQSQDSLEKLARRQAGVGRRAAKIHVRLAVELAEQRLFATALHEYQAAAELDPDNEDAQAALGRMKGNGGWVEDPEAWVPCRNVIDPSMESQSLAMYRGRRRAAFLGTILEFDELADWAFERDLKREGEAICRRILGYEPSHQKALGRLGYEKVESAMVGPADRAIRESLRKRVLASDGGQVVTEKSEVEEKTGWILSKRRSKNFFFEAKYTDGELRSLVRHAEAARGLFLEIFAIPEEASPGFVHGIFTRAVGDHEAFLEKCTDLTELERFIAQGLQRYDAWNPNLFEVYGGERFFAYLQEAAVHAVVHFHLHDFARMEETPPWLAEGLSIWFTDRMTGSARMGCSQAYLDDIRAGDPASTLRWKRLLRQMTWDGTMPRLADLFRAGVDSLDFRLMLKAWSFTDFLITRHRDKLLPLITALRNGSSSSRAVRDAFGASSLFEVERLWEAHVASME